LIQVDTMGGMKKTPRF